MHGDVVAIGPLMWALLAVGVLSWLLALFVTVDGLWRRAADFAGVPETRWPYVTICAAYVVTYSAFQFEEVTERASWLGTVVIVGLPVVLAAGAAYLLRVVFPKRGASAAADSGVEHGPDTTNGRDLPEEHPE